MSRWASGHSPLYPLPRGFLFHREHRVANSEIVRLGRVILFRGASVSKLKQDRPDSRRPTARARAHARGNGSFFRVGESP